MEKDNSNNLLNKNSVVGGENEVVRPEKLTKHQRYYLRKKEKFENLQREAEAYRKEIESYRGFFNILFILGTIFLFLYLKNAYLKGRATESQGNTTDFQYQKFFRNSFRK
jgi:hypothetical protein